MSAPLHIVQVNAAYDPDAATADALLDRYPTLTGWSTAVRNAGAQVTVVQRYGADVTIDRDGVRYELVGDRLPPWLSTGEAPPAFVDAVARCHADVIHINGLIFPGLVAAIREQVRPKPAIVVQHHGGEFPVRGSGPVGAWRRKRWRDGLRAADAVSFTAADQATPWREAGVLIDQQVLEIVEASTTLRSVPRERARAAIGVSGRPLILWVGRLTQNKDPLTALAGFERALPHLPGAAVVMVFGSNDLLDEVTARVRASSTLRDAVTLAGHVPHDEMPNYYGAADVFVSCSHAEGSGYALIEALSAGVVPVVTDIPPFRVIAGRCGTRWPAGDANAFANALREVCGDDLGAARAQAAAHFGGELCWDAIGGRTVTAYRQLVQQKAQAV